MEDRILLINPKGITSEPLVFPLGLGYLSSILKQDKYNIEILDMRCEIDGENALRHRIQKEKYVFVGITSLITNYEEVKHISKTIRSIDKTVPIIAGGPMPSAIPEMLLKYSNVDICVLGEGETTITKIAYAYRYNCGIDSIPNIYYKKGNDIIKNSRVEEYCDLDILPFPDWSSFDIQKYIMESEGYLHPSMDIITSRGCPYQCTFCFSGVSGKKYRKRTAANILEEIILLKKKYEIRGFTIRDDTFVIDENRVYELCEKIMKAEIRMKWSCNGRIDLMDYKMLKIMHNAGCDTISYGIESGNKETLKTLKKNIDLEKAKEIISNTRKAGIMPVGYFMIGLPGENRETINKTIEFCKESGIVPHFDYFGPIPGTELYQYAIEKGYIKNEEEYIQRLNWKKLSINMTELTDKEICEMTYEIEKDIMRYNIFRYPKLLLLIVMYAIRTLSMKEIIIKTIKWLQRIF